MHGARLVSDTPELALPTFQEPLKLETGKYQPEETSAGPLEGMGQQS